MTKEIYEAIKERVRPATKEQVEAYYKSYPNTDRSCPVYFFSLKGIDCCSGIVQAVRTKNIWNVSQHFYGFLKFFEDGESKLLDSRHISCK